MLRRNCFFISIRIEIFVPFRYNDKKTKGRKNYDYTL